MNQGVSNHHLQVAERATGPTLIVVALPGFDDGLGLGQ